MKERAWAERIRRISTSLGTDKCLLNVLFNNSSSLDLTYLRSFSSITYLCLKLLHRKHSISVAYGKPQIVYQPLLAMASTDEEATLSIPSLAFVAFLSFFIIRYFMSSRSSSGDSTSRRNGQRFTPAQVEQITQMFPQLNRRDIMWDLQRNGGSVSATTERILGGRGLEPVRCARPFLHFQ